MAYNLLGIILIILVVSSLSYYEAEKIIEGRISSELNNLARDRTMQIETLWNTRIAQVELFLENPSISSFIETSPHRDAISDSKRLEKLNNLREEVLTQFNKLMRSRGYATITILDSKGQVLLSNDISLKTTDFSQSSLFTKGLQGHFYKLQSDSSPENTLLIVTPYNDPKSGKAIAVVMVTRSTNAANTILIDRNYLGQTGETYLVNSQKMMITDSRFVQNAAFHQKVDTLPVKQCFENDQSIISRYSNYNPSKLQSYPIMGKGGITYADYRSIDVFGASNCQKDLGFVIIAEFDQSEIFAPLKNLSDQMIILSIIVLTIMIPISTVFSNKIISPINQLYNAILLAKNEVYQTIHFNKDTEVGRLANAYGELIAVIKKRDLQLRQNSKRLEFVVNQLENKTKNLQENDIAKSEFTSMMSHELRTPLVPILGHTEMLLSEMDGKITAEQRNQLTVIHRNSMHLKQLIEDLLDIHKLKINEMHFYFEKININELVRYSIDSIMPIVKSKKIQLICNMDDEIELICDGTRILQVLNNILANSLKFINENVGEIKIKVSNHDEYILFSIYDNGKGIPENKQQNIFKKFYQVDNSATRSSGTGLGLAICKEIVIKHKGKIWFESKENNYTVFYILLPKQNEIMGKINNSHTLG